MTDHSSIAGEILAVTAPVYFLVFVGMFLKRVAVINDNFIKVASNLVYKVTMPLMLFMAIRQADLVADVNYDLMGYYTLSNLATLILAGLVAYHWVPEAQKAVVVQGIFRGNHGIIALALVVNLFGDEGLKLGGAMVALAAVINNIISPFIFAFFRSSYEVNTLRVLKEVFLSPLVIGVLGGVAASLVDLWLPKSVELSVKQFSSITLPLALICIGASLSINTIRSSGALTLHTTLGKLVWVPLLFTPIGYWLLSLSALEVGILFIFLAVPTAAISYVLAEISGADAGLAASIVVLTTFASLLTISAGLYILSLLGWI